MQMLLVSLSMLLVCSFTAAAQVTVTGTVQDETGDPLPGVTVMVKGTSTGTSTNIDGQYTINAPADGTLTFTYVGMNPQEIKVAGRTTINVTMKEDTQMLDEVVVVGYGQQKKVTMTGAVSAVGSKEIVKTVGTSLSQSLVGKLPGLITMQSGGRPGNDGVTIQVRGATSYKSGGTTPLIIVDGVNRGSDGLAAIDPNEVESISVLKDGASCAVYGMEANNGVIIITTKRGKEGTAKVSYRGTVTLNQPTALPKMMNGTQYMEWYNKAQILDGVDPANVLFTPDMIAATTNGDLTDGIENTDWLSTMKKTTLNTQHNITLTGGSQNAHYFMSGGFMKQNGNLKGQSYQRGNFRTNVDAKVVNSLTVQFSAAGIVADSYYPSGQTYATSYGGYSLENQMLYSAPYIPKAYYMCDPSDPHYGMPTSGFRNIGQNPEYAAGHTGFMESRRVTINTSGRVDWDTPFLPGFKASFFFAWDWYDLRSKSFNYTYQLMAWNPGTKKYVEQTCPNLTPTGNMAVGDGKNQDIVLRPSISYTNTFAGKHNVDAIFLYEERKNSSSSLSANSNTFAFFELPYLSQATKVPDNVRQVHSESAGKSLYKAWIGRVAYNYEEKYLAEFSFRYDGSFIFQPKKRWGFFPAGSLGWVLSRENWFKDFAGDNVNFLKIRGSVGVTGNQRGVGGWLYRQNYSAGLGNAVFGTTPTTAPILSSVYAYLQDNLTWEKCRQFNIGAELTMWNGLLGVEADYFYKYTHDILDTVSTLAFAPSLGGNYPTIDPTGRFDNRGFELVLRHTNRIGKVGYNLNANLTWAHNKTLRRTESAGVLPWQSSLGNPLGQVMGFRALGLYQTQEQIDNMPKPIGQTPRIGDIMYEDLNGDGKITSDDQTWIARSQMPEMMFALNGEANWNGFDLSFQFSGAALCDKMLGSGMADFCPLTRPWYGNWDNSPLYLVEGSWTPDNVNAEYPRLSVVGNAQNAYISTFWKRNGAYLRLKNLTVGYTIPTKITKKAGISNARFFASGVNLFTITDFKYLDPEGGNFAWSFYPQQRTFTFGLDLSF
ncbi:MAG: TonB-dependent receptor [Bacteroides sp.]|nr:TonB-dependent receptor [Bacteroides sp.]